MILECRIFIYHIYLQNQTKLKSVSKETSLPNIKAITLLYIPLFSSCMSILFYIETLLLTYQDWIVDQMDCNPHKEVYILCPFLQTQKILNFESTSYCIYVLQILYFIWYLIMWKLDKKLTYGFQGAYWTLHAVSLLLKNK